MTEDRDSGEEPHPVRSKFIFVSQQRVSEELLGRIKRAVQREEAEEAHRRVSRAADTMRAGLQAQEDVT